MILVMSVFPGFSGQSYIEGSEERVAYVAQVAKERNPDLLIEVDGGISAERTAGLVCAEGADVLVAGSGVFAAEDPARAIEEIRLAGTNAPSRQGACIAHGRCAFRLSRLGSHGTAFARGCSCYGALS